MDFLENFLETCQAGNIEKADKLMTRFVDYMPLELDQDALDILREGMYSAAKYCNENNADIVISMLKDCKQFVEDEEILTSIRGRTLVGIVKNKKLHPNTIINEMYDILELGVFQEDINRAYDSAISANNNIISRFLRNELGAVSRRQFGKKKSKKRKRSK